MLPAREKSLAADLILIHTTFDIINLVSNRDEKRIGVGFLDKREVIQLNSPPLETFTSLFLNLGNGFYQVCHTFIECSNNFLARRTRIFKCVMQQCSSDDVIGCAIFGHEESDRK